MRKLFISSIVICLYALLLSTNLFATDYSSKSSGNWSSSGSWTPTGIPGSGDNITILSGCNVTINGTYSCKNVTINPGGTLTSNSSKSLTIYGNLSNFGTFVSSTGTINFNGTSAQTISGNNVTFYNFTLNNSTGLTLAANINITNTLTMTSGNIAAYNYLLTLGSSTSSLGTLSYSSGSIITGSTGGFKRWFAKSTVSNVYFPVGTVNYLNMMTLSFTAAPSNGGSLTALFVPSDPGTNSATSINDSGYTLDSYSPRGYWQINTGDAFSGGTYNISLRGQGFNPLGTEITNFAHLRVIKRPAAGNNWTALGTHLDATQSNTDPIVNRKGLSGFSQFAIAGNSTDGNPLQGPMPVELSTFTASINDRDVKLSWTTADEHNNSGFEIYRASKDDNNNWTKIGFVAGNGTKNTPTNYSFEDKKLSTGKFSYRLKQIDYNGNYEYFNLNSAVVIGAPKKSDLSQNYPNPFNPTTSIDYQITEDSKVTLKVYDISGREVKTLVNMNQKSGFYTVQFNALNLSSGNYFYKLITSSNGNETVITKKMTVIK